MSFLIKYGGEKPSLEEVARALHEAVSAEGAGAKVLEPPRKHQDGKREFDVLGMVTYEGAIYDMLYHGETVRRGELQSEVAFDALGDDEISALAVFTEANGIGFPAERMNFQPSPSQMAFLLRVGRRLKQALPGVESMVLAYYRDTDNDPHYEKVE